MSEMVPVSMEELDVIGRVVKAIGDTEFVPSQLRGRPGAILGAILYGRALGLDMSVSLREVNIIEGTPSLSATATLGLIRKAGHSVEISETEDSCTAEGIRADNGNSHVSVFTTKDAERAKLTSKPNYQRYPGDMLRSRAVSRLARALFSDVFAGASIYSPEEAEEIAGSAASHPSPPPPPSPAPPPPVPQQAAGPAETGSASQPPPTSQVHAHEGAEEAEDAEWHEETEAERRRRLDARLAIVCRDADPGLLPEGFGNWEGYSRWLAKERFGVVSRSELSNDQKQELIQLVETETIPF